MLKNLKLILDLLPPLLFLATYKFSGMHIATLVLMASNTICAAIYWLTFRNINKMMLFTLFFVLGCGSMSIYFDDPDFIKMKPTIFYCFISLFLLGSVIIGKNVISIITDGKLNLTSKKAKAISFYFTSVFLLFALLNEYVWRNYSEGAWINFKVMVFPIINVLAVIICYFLFLRKPLENQK